MELLLAIILWPFVVFAVGLALILLFDVSGPGIFGAFSAFWWVLLLVVLVVMGRKNKLSGKPQTAYEQLETTRQFAIIASIALLLPIFVRYLFKVFDSGLPAAILGLMLGFGVAAWGMFIKGHKAVTYGNIIGGAIIILYVYAQLWNMGDVARIIAAAFGLGAAVVVSVIKLKDKLS